jgi:hypothetical protein
LKQRKHEDGVSLELLRDMSYGVVTGARLARWGSIYLPGATRLRLKLIYLFFRKKVWSTRERSQAYFFTYLGKVWSTRECSQAYLFTYLEKRCGAHGNAARLAWSMAAAQCCA